MKDIEIFYDNTWSKASITFLELGINIISNVKNKIENAEHRRLKSTTLFQG